MDEMGKNRIFISYRKNEQDTRIAEQIRKALLDAGQAPFMAHLDIPIGSNWANLIPQLIDSCDYFICLLSEEAQQSEMVTEEIRLAKEAYNRNDKKNPGILPIFIKISAHSNINYDVSSYLNRIQCRFWYSEFDTQSIITEILSVINSGKPKIEETSSSIEFKPNNNLPVPNAPLEVPSGQISLDSPFYITRKGENEFIRKILDPGALLRIKAPRQFGKTSLLQRIIEFAKNNDHEAIIINFQQLNQQNINDLEKLYMQICTLASRALRLENKVKQHWADDMLDIKIKFSSYFEEYILPNTQKSVLLAIDEADILFKYPEISTEFFGSIRAINEEAKTSAIWKRFKIALSYSTDSKLAIPDLNQSPFNTGLEKILMQFTLDEVKLLVEKHLLHLSQKQITDLMEFIGGHPYLIRKCLYDIASNIYSFEFLIKNIANDDGPFNDHLSTIQWNLLRNPETLEVMKAILHTGFSKKDIICNNLRSSGLITGSNPEYQASLKIYQLYLQKRL